MEYDHKRALNHHGAVVVNLHEQHPSPLYLPSTHKLRMAQVTIRRPFGELDL
jgi:hypothetical protein